ncbi:hypothetical protein Tco_0108934 [Tanacetum coccineum]
MSSRSLPVRTGGGTISESSAHRKRFRPLARVPPFFATDKKTFPLRKQDDDPRQWRSYKMPSVESALGIPSVMYKERTKIYGYSLLRRDVHD